MSDPRGLYLDLLARCLLDALHPPASGSRPPRLRQRLPRLADSAWAALRLRLGGRSEIRLTDNLSAFDARERVRGPIWPERAHTMIGEKGLANLRFCIEEVLRQGVPGDLIETGVWRGGASIFMRGVLAAHAVTDRVVYVADSFRGLPRPDAAHAADRGSIAHLYDDLRVSRAAVEENFRLYGLLDEQVRFLEGWFADTLPGSPIERLAVIRLDGDMYGSTLDALRSLYPRLSVGGFVIVDDYRALAECRQAVEDYRRQHGITDEIVDFDWSGSWWRRTE